MGGGGGGGAGSGGGSQRKISKNPDKLSQIELPPGPSPFKTRSRFQLILGPYLTVWCVKPTIF